MIHLRLKIKLTLIGPVLTQATNAGAFGVDAVIARDRQERPYLPYSLVRGKLRQSLEELQNALRAPEDAAVESDITRWFGPRWDSDDFANQRGTLFFGDFVHPHAKPEGQLLSRIQMNSDTHAVEERLLLVIDTPFRYGERVEFVGEIHGLCADVAQAERTVHFLRTGLLWLTQLGAERTVGFGRVHRVDLEGIQITELTPPKEEPVLTVKAPFETIAALANPELQIHRYPCAVASSDPAATHYAIRLRPRGLFCFGSNRKRSNIFESEKIIHGNALLGALASMYCVASTLSPTTNEVKPVVGKPWQTLARNFAKLRFTHAFPSRQGSKLRPTVWPLSLVAAEPALGDIPDRLYDVALCGQPRMVPFANSERPPVFSSDWKTHVVTKKAKALFGWPEIQMELRVRTAIDPDKLRAEEEKLFAYEMVYPEGLEWLATLDLSRVPESERGQFLVDLQHLLSAGLGPLGKTKIDADIWIEPLAGVQSIVPSSVTPLSGDRWVITLQTPAILCAPDDMAWSPCGKLLAGYQRVFSELSGNTLTLERFFAKQSLSSVRFAGCLPKDKSGHYYPFLLTEEGSTFVLQGKGDVSRAQEKIQDWLLHGIPLAASLAPGFDPWSDAAWKHCPILDRHGFGEIIVNPPWLGNVVQNDWPIMLQDQENG